MNGSSSGRDSASGEEMSVFVKRTTDLAGYSGGAAKVRLRGFALLAAAGLASAVFAGTAMAKDVAPPAGTTGVPVGAATGKNGVVADNRTASVTDQIMALRRKLREAVAKQDRATLETLYHDRFTHLRETGRAETKKERIDFLISGQTGIELASADQALIETFNADTAVLSGVSVIANKDRAKSGTFQWLTLYVRDKEGHWKVALSQANRLPKPE